MSKALDRLDERGRAARKEARQPRTIEPMLAVLRDERSLVGEFHLTEWTEAGRLRHPSFLGLRQDKSPRDVVGERPRR